MININNFNNFQNGYCKFTKTTEGFVTAQMSYAFQKKSPLKPMFDKT